MLILGTIAIFLIIIFSVLALENKNMLYAIVFLSIVSLLTTLVFIILKAPDVALTEGAIGVGLTTFLFLMIIKKINQISSNKKNENIKNQNNNSELKD